MAAKTPRKLADVAMRLPDGKPLKFSKYRGKLTAILLVSTECHNCSEAVAVFNFIQKDYVKKGVQFVGAAVNSDAPNKLSLFMANAKPEFPFGFMDEPTTRKAADMGNPDPTQPKPYVPIIMFVDKTGTVTLQQYGNSGFFSQFEKAMRVALDNMIRNSSPAPKAPTSKAPVNKASVTAPVAN